jgi:urease beta subunit
MLLHTNLAHRGTPQLGIHLNFTRINRLKELRFRRRLVCNRILKISTNHTVLFLPKQAQYPNF